MLCACLQLLLRKLEEEQHTMAYVTYSINKFDENVSEYLVKLNASLTNGLTFIVKKYQSDEIKTYDSNITEKVMYSKNFDCYLFFLKFDKRTTISMIECFDVIGNVN